MMIRDMEILLLKVRNKKILPLMEESMRCYNAFAYRASITISFNAMFHDLCDKLEALKETNPPIRDLYQEIEKKKQKQEVYESYLIDHLALNNLITRLEKDILDGIRTMRNKASHPTDHEPTAEEARYVFSTIIDLVLSKGRILSRSAADALLSSLADSNYFPSKSDLKDAARIVAFDIESIHESAIIYLISKVIGSIGSNPEEENYVIFLIALLNQNKDDLYKITVAQINKTKYTKDEFKWLVVAISVHCPEVFEDKYFSRIMALLSIGFDDNSYPLSSIRSVRKAFISIAEKNPSLYNKFIKKQKDSVFSRYETWDLCIFCDSRALIKDFLNYFVRWLSPKYEVEKEQYKRIQKRVSFLTKNDKQIASKLDGLDLIKLIFVFLLNTRAKINHEVEGNPSESLIEKIAETIPHIHEKLCGFRSENPDAYNEEASKMKVTGYIDRLS